jgi:hypothetical protein
LSLAHHLLVHCLLPFHHQLLLRETLEKLHPLHYGLLLLLHWVLTLLLLLHRPAPLVLLTALQ